MLLSLWAKLDNSHASDVELMYLNQPTQHKFVPILSFISYYFNFSANPLDM